MEMEWSVSKRGAVLGAVALLLAAAPAGASRMVPQRLEDLMARTRSVVHARVLETRTLVAAESGRVTTAVSLLVIEEVAGRSLGSTFEIEVPGGVVDGAARVVVGAPWFEPGDEYFLLIRDAGPGRPTLTSLLGGSFQVRFDPRLGEVVRNDLARRGLVGVEAASEVPYWTPEELKERLVGAWKRAGGDGHE